MRRIWGSIYTLAALYARRTAAVEVMLDQTEENGLRCSGMYSKTSWSGDVDPFIQTTFVKDEEHDSLVSVVIYEHNDRGLLGRKDPDDPDDPLKTTWVCDEYAIQKSYCNETQRGEVLLDEDAVEKSKNPILTKGAHIKEPPSIKYSVKKTGYYCVLTTNDGSPYKAVVEFRNAYGELPAAQIAKLPFYGGLTLVYAVIGVYWGFLYFQNRHDILPVQNYITAILIFLVVEMLITWGFYDYQNVHGGNVGAKIFMFVVSILNAARNSFSFFLLLIVCMGYGVVKPSLGRTMVWVRGLAIAHFVFGVIYAVTSMNVHPERVGAIVLLVILPLSGTLTAFYIWTLNSLNLTMKDLVERKQHVKASMYKKLWWCIFASILVIFGFFFFNSFTFVSVGNDDFAPKHWQTRWFVLDGWLNLVYLVDVAYIAYLWRPTANNRRFAMSDEIAQDDEGFEINSIRDSLDSLDDLEAGSKPTNPRGASAPLHASNADPSGSAFERRRDASSPLPAPKPTRPAHGGLPRESLDGETIFAVGEDDKWSDEEGDGGEREGLVGK